MSFAAPAVGSRVQVRPWSTERRYTVAFVRPQWSNAGSTAVPRRCCTHAGVSARAPGFRGPDDCVKAVRMLPSTGSIHAPTHAVYGASAGSYTGPPETQA